jgi:hypothetical protein
MNGRNGSGIPPEISILRDQYAEQKDRDAVDHAFYAAASGDPNTAPVQFSVLVAANAQLFKAYPGQIKTVFEQQTAATVKALEKLPTPQQVSELSKELTEVRQAYRHLQYAKAPETRPENVVKRIALGFAVGVAVFAFGYFVCWSRSHLALETQIAEKDALVSQILASQPRAGLEQSEMWSHKGYFEIQHASKNAPLIYIIAGGDRKLGTPALWSDNTVHVPTTSP